MAPMAFRLLFLAAACCAGATSARGPEQPRIRGYYHDGEFDKVIKELEGFRKSGASCTRAESVFVEKYLAVVYAANPVTRELGRYHMFRMLDLSPGSDLLDMFVGEEVDAVFQKVGREHSLRTPAPRPRPVTATPPARSASPAPVRAPKLAWNRAPAAVPVRATRIPPSREAAASYEPTRPSALIPARVAAIAPEIPVPAPSAQGSVSKTVSMPASPFVSASATGPGTTAGLPAEEAAGPAWKEPGLWIGGGAALAVVAFTLFYPGSDDTRERKTYVVSSTASR